MSNANGDGGRGGAWNFNTAFGAIGIAFGVALFAITPDQVERPRLLFGQKPSGLDPDFFPRLVAVLAVIVGAWLIVRSRVLREVNGLRALDAEGVTSVLVTVAGFLVMAALMPRLGFVLSSFLLLAVLSTFYGNRNWLAGILVSAGVPFAFYNILRVWLKVLLPQNPFFPDFPWF